MKKFRFSLIAILLIILSICFWSFYSESQLPKLEVSEFTSKNEKIEELDKWLKSLQEQKKFNGAVLISRRGLPIFQKTYGYTNASLDEKLTIHSMFRLASLSKQFTAMGMMILKEKGLLDFDDKVSDYIPHLPYKNITIRNLLNHTSGIPDNYIKLYDENKMGILTNEKAVDLVIEKNQKARRKPNEEYSYSNTGYILAARTIEIISGKSLEAFLKDELFTPIGMNHTRVWNLVSNDKTFSNKTSSFRYEANHAEALQPTGIDGVAGDGAIFSSINDFLIWDQFLYGNDLISPSTLKEAFTAPTLLNGQVSEYGFGWGITSNIISHTGAWLGARTVIRRDTLEKSCIVILDNSQSKNVGKILDQIISVKM